MAAELLDYNQIHEQTAANGDSVPSAGGLISWNFRADPNLAIDFSQTYFYMEVTVTHANGDNYVPDAQDFYPFFPLRCFSSTEHQIDGVTVARSNNPHADKMIQETLLHDTTETNLSNFESQLLARSIDDGNPEHNLFMSGVRQVLPNFREVTPRYFDINANKNNANRRAFLFKPPFDMWEKHQRVDGGNHQIHLNLRPADSTWKWGNYCQTSNLGDTVYNMYDRDLCSRIVGSGITSVENAAGAEAFLTAPGNNWVANITVAGVGEYNATTRAYDANRTWFGSAVHPSGVGTNTQQTLLNALYNAYVIGDATITDSTYKTGLIVDIERIRLLKRVVRFQIERPIGVQTFNCTEINLYHGVSITGDTASWPAKYISQATNFTLPSSTFGVYVYFRQSNDAQYSDFQGYPRTQYGWDVDSGEANAYAISRTYPSLGLDSIQFTYGGTTYPATHIDGLMGTTTSHSKCYKLQAISHMLQGIMSTDQQRYPSTFGGTGAMRNMGNSGYFFPVAKSGDTDNGDMQIEVSLNPCWIWHPSTNSDAQAIAAAKVCMVVAVVYDSELKLLYNPVNQLVKVHRTIFT